MVKAFLVGHREDHREYFPSSARTSLSVLGSAEPGRVQLPPPCTPIAETVKSGPSSWSGPSKVEAAGVEPASASGSYRASTCVASLSISPGAASEQPAPRLAT